MSRKKTDYNININPLFNDLTKYWTKHGYIDTGTILEKGQANQKLGEASLLINKGGGGKRRRIALLNEFGKNLLTQVEYIRLDYDDNKTLNYTKSDGSIRRKDYQIQIPPKFNYKPRQVVKVELFGTLIDRIPIVEVEYSTFVKGQYKKKGSIERVVVVEGTKKVRMGIRAPTGINDAQFWSEVYRELKGKIVDEFFDAGFKKANWDVDDDFLTRIKGNVEVGGDFPKNYQEMRQK